MKYLFLLLITFNAHAWYVAVDDQFSCEGKNRIYPKLKQCRIDHPNSKCEKMPKDYRCEYFKLESVMGDDLSKPLYEAKSNVYMCDKKLDNPETPDKDESMSKKDDCLRQESEHVCPDTHYVVRSSDDVYCTRVVGYEQKEVAKKLKLDADKKAAYLAEKQAKKDAKQAEKNEIDAIKLKLKNADSLSQDELNKILKYLLK